VNIIDRKQTIETSAAADFERFRLRRFMDELPAEELDVRGGMTDLADVAAALDGNARAVRF